MTRNQVTNRGIQAVQANGHPQVEAVLQRLQDGFEDFKAKHGQDAELLKDLQAAVDDAHVKMAAMEMNGALAPVTSVGSKDELVAMAQFSRSGVVQADLSIGGGNGEDLAKGGYTVLPMVSDAIYSRMFDQSALARLARTVDMSHGNVFQEPQDLGQPEAEWVGETDERPNTDTANFALLSVPLNEVYSNQKITQGLLDDTSYDLGGWLSERISDKLGRAAGNAFLNGDGDKKPKGLLTYALSADDDAERPWGTIQAKYTEEDGGITGPDVLVDLVYALRSTFRKNARWMMNSKTAGTLRKMKDADGRFLWSEALAAGEPPLLLGYPVEIDEYMPDMTAGSVSILFGNFGEAYCVVRRPGVRFLRDPFTEKPHVLFYAYKRVGGAMQNSEAVKALVFGSPA